MSLARIGPGVDGTLFVYDRHQRRFTFLDSRGAVTGVQRIARSGEVLPLVRLQGGASLALFEPRPSLPQGLQRGPVFLVRADASWEVVDTLGGWAGKERYPTPEGEEIEVRFGATALFDGRGLHTVVGTGSVEVTTALPKQRHELLDVTAGRIAILRRGELAGEFVEVYQVELPR